MQCELRYGRSGLALELPESGDVTVVRRISMPAATDPEAEIVRAIESPIGGAGLEAEASGMHSACILICDVTRPVPNGLILRPLVERLVAAGVPAEAVTVLVATGLHRPNEGAELDAVLGDPWVQKHVRVANHFARNDSDHLHLGTTSQGIPVRLDRRFVEADVRIVVGLVEPHFMPGWSGGRKLLLPGIAHAETITAFHAARILERDGAEAGRLEGNPLHEAQEEVLRTAGRVLGVNVVIDEQMRLAYASFGKAEDSLAAAIAFAERYVAVPVPRRFPVVLSTGAGYPLDATYYQAIKGICTGASIIEPGGELFVAAACSEGMGSAEFRAAQERLVRLGPQLFRAEAATRAQALVDEWQTLMLARAVQPCTLHVFAEGLSEPDLALLGGHFETDLMTALDEAMHATGGPLAVLPDGPYTLPRLFR